MRAESSNSLEGRGHDEVGGEAEEFSTSVHPPSPPAETDASPRSTRSVSFDLPTDGIDLGELERRLVEQALERTGGNKTRAGALLGLTRDQVRYRMQKYGLRDAD